MSSKRVPSDNPWGYNVVGFLSGNFGLSAAARNTVRVLEERGEPIARIDVDPGAGRVDESVKAAWVAREPEFAVNLFHVNPAEVRKIAGPRWPALEPVSRLNVCVPFWELPHLPVIGWRDVLAAMDVVLAPSLFIQDAVSEALPRTRVIHYPQATFVPEVLSRSRADFGLPEDETLFYMSMDMTSDPERKNPRGTIDAFMRAFRTEERAGLVIKVSNVGHNKLTRDQHELLRVLTADPRIHLIDVSMSHADVLALSNACDAYVSLHRSEGLGLNIMEAMSLAKPVIVTGWSGNMDFCTQENSLLVGHTLIPVLASNPAYGERVIGEGQEWGDPDLDDAARLMRAVFDSPDHLADLGARAKRDMEDLRTSFERGAVFDELRAIADAMTPAEAEEPARVRRLKGAMRDPLWARSKRRVGAVLRKAGLR